MNKRDGIWCPTCGSETMVTDTRAAKDALRRRRKCSEGHRFSTLEKIIPEKPKAVKPVAGKNKLAKMNLPLTYLSIEQKARARKFFEAGWTVAEVAPLFDMTQAQLRK